MREFLATDATGAEAPDLDRSLNSAEVVYDWDLVSDSIQWGANLASIVKVKDVARLATGMGYAEHLAAASPSSRYEAVVTSDGCDTGGGVPYKAVYGLLQARRSRAAPIWIEDTGRWFADADDRPGRAHGIIRVITERYEAERSHDDPRRDRATGAFTRAHFIEHVTRHLGLSARRKGSFAVLLIGIAPTGPTPQSEIDTAIAAALDRVRGQMRTQEILARHGESTFMVLLESCNADQAEVAAARFIDVVRGGADGSTPVEARIGAVLAPCLGRSAEALVRCAEEALEIACCPDNEPYKRHEPDAVRPVAKPPTDPADEIVAALNDNRVLLALQPIVDATTRKTASYEALVRIRRVDGTLMMPAALVPIATKNALGALIDRRVLDLAFAMLAADRKLSLSINASIASLGEACWLDHLRAASKVRPDAARRLTIEIAETCLIADLDAAAVLLATLKATGVKVAIDDFGSGNWSFRALSKLSVDLLKIDGAFAQNLVASSDGRFFIRTLIDLARNLGIPTVAEWIEDEATARILADWGVQYLQGHLFGKAMIADGPPMPRQATR